MTAALFALALAALFIVCAIDCRRSARRAERSVRGAHIYHQLAKGHATDAKRAANINAKWSKS